MRWRLPPLAALVLGGALGSPGGLSAQTVPGASPGAASATRPARPPAAGEAPAAQPGPSPARGAAAGPTPMAERIATIGLLEKRTARSQFVEMKPGQVITYGALTVALRACETTPPWEDPMTGAFLQIDERGRDGRNRRVFSGWTYAEIPGLNPFEHPRYDVWVRSCAMRFPEKGPDTVAASPAPSRSSAKKSARRETASDSSAR